MINVKLDGKAKATVSKTAGISGTSYTAGNGITITEENVINADLKVLVVEDIEALTNEQCNSLNAGDIVVVNDMAYKVLEKGSQDLQLQIIYTDAIETQFYYRQNENSNWEYQGMEETPLDISGVEYVEINPDGGTLGYDDYQKLTNGAYIKFAQPQEAEFNGSEVICLPNHQVDELVYSSVVKDGKYYQVEFTVDHIEFECTYEVKILDAIDYVILDGMSGYINVDNGDYQKLLNGAYIKLISGGEEEMMYGDNTVLVPNHDNYDLVYSSTIRDGKYLQFEINSSVVSEFGMAYTITEHSVGGGDISPIAIFDISDYSTDAELEPDQWDNQMIYEACQGSICFIVYGLHGQKAFVSYADLYSGVYTFKLTGSTIEPGEMSGFGWNQENQRFFRASDPK